MKLFPSEKKAIRHLGDILREVGALTLYAACSVAGSVYQSGHHLEGARRPVVLVPGFLGRGLAFHRLKRALARRGHPVFVADLGFGVGCIQRKSRILEEFIEEKGLDDFYLLGHSMGGLIALGMEEEVRRKVRHFITMGTAFRGAVLSYLVPVFPAARQLRPQSALLEGLLIRAREQENLTNIIARWDEIAIPLAACRLDGRCEEVSGVAGHAQLILSPSSVRQITEILDRFERPPGSRTPG